MDTSKIPNNLHHLMDLVATWGICDDGYRDELIENSTTEELQYFVDSVDDTTLDNLNKWLSDENEITKSSDEYVNYSCFYMAFEYAEAVLKDRIS